MPFHNKQNLKKCTKIYKTTVFRHWKKGSREMWSLKKEVKNEPYHWALETLSKPQHKEGNQGKAWTVLINWTGLRLQCRDSQVAWIYVAKYQKWEGYQTTPIISVIRDRAIHINHTETLGGKKWTKIQWPWKNISKVKHTYNRSIRQKL